MSKSIRSTKNSQKTNEEAQLSTDQSRQPTFSATGTIYSDNNDTEQYIDDEISAREQITIFDDLEHEDILKQHTQTSANIHPNSLQPITSAEPSSSSDNESDIANTSYLSDSSDNMAFTHATISPPIPFTGKASDHVDPKLWLQSCEYYFEYKGMEEDKMLKAIPCMLRDVAIVFLPRSARG